MTKAKQENADCYHQIRREIKRGLVLRLDPEKMKLWRATCKTEEIYQIKGPHYFACIGTGIRDDWSFWIPASSRYGKGRTYVGYADKRGYEILGWRNNLRPGGAGLGGKGPSDDFLSGIGSEKEWEDRAELHRAVQIALPSMVTASWFQFQ